MADLEALKIVTKPHLKRWLEENEPNTFTLLVHPNYFVSVDENYNMVKKTLNKDNFVFMKFDVNRQLSEEDERKFLGRQWNIVVESNGVSFCYYDISNKASDSC